MELLEVLQLELEQHEVLQLELDYRGHSAGRGEVVYAAGLRKWEQVNVALLTHVESRQPEVEKFDRNEGPIKPLRSPRGYMSNPFKRF